MANIKELRDEELNEVNGGLIIENSEALSATVMEQEKINCTNMKIHYTPSEFKTNTFKQVKLSDARLTQSKTLSSRLANSGYFPAFIITWVEAVEKFIG